MRRYKPKLCFKLWWLITADVIKTMFLVIYKLVAWCIFLKIFQTPSKNCPFNVTQCVTRVESTLYINPTWLTVLLSCSWPASVTSGWDELTFWIPGEPSLRSSNLFISKAIESLTAAWGCKYVSQRTGKHECGSRANSSVKRALRPGLTEICLT